MLVPYYGGDPGEPAGLSIDHAREMRNWRVVLRQPPRRSERSGRAHPESEAPIRWGTAGGVEASGTTGGADELGEFVTGMMAAPRHDGRPEERLCDMSVHR